MRSFILTILSFLIVIAALGQNAKSSLKYKPHNLDEAVSHLELIHPDTLKRNIIAMTESEFIGNSHFGLGMWIRNNWGLWKGGKLAKYFNAMGISHPDDMSGIILTSYYRQLKGQERKLESQVQYYQDYWKSTNEHLHKLDTDTAYQRQMEKSEDSLEKFALDNKKLLWSAGKKVSGYINKRCDFINDFLSRTKIEGTIVEWENDKLLIKVTRYYDEQLKHRLTKCHKISNDVLVVPDHKLFQLEE